MAYGFLWGNSVLCWEFTIAIFVLSILSIRAVSVETCCWGVSCFLGQTWGHGSDCSSTSQLFSLGAGALLLSFFPLNLSSFLLLSLQFLSRVIAFLHHCLIELGYVFASINFLLIFPFIPLLNSLISECPSYPLPFATFLKSCTNSSIFSPLCSILFNSAILIDPSSLLSNSFLISHKQLDRFTQSNLCWKVLIKPFSIIYGILHSNKYS